MCDFIHVMYIQKCCTDYMQKPHMYQHKCSDLNVSVRACINLAHAQTSYVYDTCTQVQMPDFILLDPNT